MRITHYIAPRACGKTTFAENMQMEDPENILLYKIERGLWSWGQPLRGQHWKKIVMDEYIERYNELHVSDKDRFIDWIHNMVLAVCDELILISTPDMLYSQEEIALSALTLNGEIKEYGILDCSKLREKVEEINNKFLNPALRNLNIVRTNFSHQKFNEVEKSEIMRDLGEECYRTDILGEFLK